MATITKIKNRWKVRVCVNNKRFFATFGDKETAELWAIYKESIAEEIKNFEFDLDKTITLFEAIKIKIEKLKKFKADRKTILDVENLNKDFKELINTKICMISYNDLLSHAKNMFSLKGKSTENMSITTILNKLRRLSSVYSSIIEDGINVENIPLKISSYLKENYDQID